jgi:hypothetical protein
MDEALASPLFRTLIIHIAQHVFLFYNCGARRPAMYLSDIDFGLGQYAVISCLIKRY